MRYSKPVPRIPHNRRYSDQEYLDAYMKHGQSTIRAAKALGVWQPTVNHALHRLGIRVGRSKRNPVHKLPMQEIASRYLAGESTVELAKAYSGQLKGSPKPEEVIRRRLRSMRVVRRKGGLGDTRGHKNYQWKGRGGYKTMHYYRRLSYEVAAICLGRPLLPGAVVNHFDEDPYNNNPENLCVFPTQKEHSLYHQSLLRRQRAGETVDTIQVALENGGQLLQRPVSLIGVQLHISPHALSKMDVRGGRGRKGSRLAPVISPKSARHQ